MGRKRGHWNSNQRKSPVRTQRPDGAFESDMFSPKSATSRGVLTVERISVGRIHSAVGSRGRRLGGTTEEETQQ